MITGAGLLAAYLDGFKTLHRFKAQAKAVDQPDFWEHAEAVLCLLSSCPDRCPRRSPKRKTKRKPKLGQSMSAETLMSPPQDSQVVEEYDFAFFWGSDTPPEAQKHAGWTG